MKWTGRPFRLLRWFNVIARFQDDIFAGEAPMLLRARDRPEWWSPDHKSSSAIEEERAFPYRGIYPCQFLTIEREQFGPDEVNHQDITIYRSITRTRHGAVVKFHTKMYS